jgi:hypothetical protein
VNLGPLSSVESRLESMFKWDGIEMTSDGQRRPLCEEINKEAGAYESCLIEKAREYQI